MAIRGPACLSKSSKGVVFAARSRSCRGRLEFPRSTQPVRMAGVLSVHKLSFRLGNSLLSSLTNASPRTLAATSAAKNYFTYSKEPSQPVDNVPKFVSSEEAVKCIKSGKVKVYIPLFNQVVLVTHPSKISLLNWHVLALTWDFLLLGC